MFILVLINVFIFDNPLGISINISLNSFMNGGNTKTKIVKMMNDIIVIIKNKDKGLGILSPFCRRLHKLHKILDITREQIIKSKNSLKDQIIKRDINIAKNLKYDVLFNFKFLILFRIS